MQEIFNNVCNGLYTGSMPAGRPAKNQRCYFGQWLFTFREEKGLSQKYVSDKLGMTQQSYARWERRSVALKPEQITQLANILETSVDSLVGHQNGHKHRGCPVGKTRLLFEEVSKLPRYQQNKIGEFVEGFLVLHRKE